uniref:Uncharacterized protein n=1 Tax=Rodentolepis nana TaxID=102285 RepID=A0A0R3TEF7_RODNA
MEMNLFQSTPPLPSPPLASHFFARRWWRPARPSFRKIYDLGRHLMTQPFTHPSSSLPFASRPPQNHPRSWAVDLSANVSLGDAGSVKFSSFVPIDTL